jgi:hypothetical protein
MEALETLPIEINLIVGSAVRADDVAGGPHEVNPLALSAGKKPENY